MGGENKERFKQMKNGRANFIGFLNAITGSTPFYPEV